MSAKEDRSAKVVDGLPLFRAAEVVLGSVNAEKRTIDLVFTTGFKGKRSSWFGDEWFEELAVDDKSIRLARLNAAAPLLNAHQRWDLGSVIGVVERAWVQDGKGYATVRFSSRPDVDPIWQDVSTGIIRNVSVGYNVYKWEEVTPIDDKIKTMRAIDWEPFEVSFVPIGFDPGAQSARSADGIAPFKSEIIFNRSAGGGRNERGIGTMSKPVKGANADESQGTDTVETHSTTVNLDEVRAQAEKSGAAAEMKRSADIRAAVKTAKLDETFAEELVKSGVSIDAARAKIIDKWASADKTEESNNQNRVQVGDDEHMARAAGIAEQILHRWSPAANKLTDNGKRFVGFSLVELCRIHLEARGIRTSGMPRHEIAAAALSFRAGPMSTSDFPNILANVTNKALLQGFQAIELKQTFAPLARPSFTADFKQVSRVRRGEAPSLLKVPEGAEIKYGSFGESKEEYAIATYGRMVLVTEEMIVNDDLGAFTSTPRDMGAAAARLESDLVWGEITANAHMGDGINLFHADHGNLGTTGPISLTTLTEGEKLMGLQVGLGDAKLDVQPRFLIVPVAQKSLARQWVSQNMLPKAAGDVNPFAGRFEVIAEPRLDADSSKFWYLAASPDDGVDVIETLRLEGTTGPVTSMQDEWNRNGVGFKVKHYFAAKVLDWRGLFKNPYT